MNIDGVLGLASGKYTLGAIPSKPRGGGASVKLPKPNKRKAWVKLLTQQNLRPPRV